MPPTKNILCIIFDLQGCQFVISTRESDTSPNAGDGHFLPCMETQRSPQCSRKNKACSCWLLAHRGAQFSADPGWQAFPHHLVSHSYAQGPSDARLPSRTGAARASLAWPASCPRPATVLLSPWQPMRAPVRARSQSSVHTGTALLDPSQPTVHQVQVGAGNSPGAADPEEARPLGPPPCASPIPVRSTLREPWTRGPASAVDSV